jgi:disease resistance protein RPS2
MVFEVEALEMKSSSGEKIEEIGVEFEASGQDKKFEIVEIGIEPETSDTDGKTFSIIQCETHQSCLMWGGLGLTETPKEEDWKNAKKIYLMDNELFVLPKNPRCPMLSTLFLQRNYKLRTIPPSFFDYMPALQILNLSRTGIKSLPESILRLVCLKRLFLNDCHCFMILSPKVGKLKQLEVLDLEGTDIMDLPNEIKKLTNLTCLKVSLYESVSNGRRAMQSNVVIACGIISALSHLEELMINVNPDDKRWNACVEAVVSEVCTLQSLNTLKFYFPRVELVRRFLLNSPMWVYPSLSNFSFIVGHHVKRTMSRLPGDVEFELERWERCLKYINGVAVPREIQKVLQYSTAFFLERHATVKKLSDFGIGNMRQLKCCVVGECNEIGVIIDETNAHEEDSEANAHEEDDEANAHEEADAHEEEAYREDGSSGIVSKTSSAKTIVLGSLEYLYIYFMKNLRRIWEGPVQPKCLSLLKSLTLRTCPQLTTIFTTGLLDNLYNLEELTLEDCPSIKTLVSCEISAEHKTFDFLPNLKRISLHYMPGLISISSGLHIAPRLEWLSFYNCPNLKHLLIEEVSSKDLKKIKGEWNWWVALKWRSGRPSYLDDIFVPINI